MIRVLGRRNSANVQKVMWTLGELNLEYVREDIGGTFGYPSDYPNPNPVVPTLYDEDICVWESNACVRYLARTYGDGSLWPAQQAALAEADMWMEWQRSDISNAFFPLFMMLIREINASPERIARATQQCGEVFGQLDTQLEGRQFICGDELTMADIAIGAMMFRYMNLNVDRPSLPSLEAWYARLTQRPAYRKHVMLEFGSNLAEWNAHEQANAGIQ